MNSMLIYVLISCLIVVTVQQSRGEIRPKRSEPPMKKTHPVFWNGRREFYLQSKNVWYIQIGSNGNVSGSKSPTEAAVIQMISGTNQTVALKGKLADKYLCMNSQAIVYANTNPDETDCFFVENFNDNLYNTYHHSFHRRGDLKNYLSIDDDGIIRVGNRTNEVQIYFLPVDISTRVKTTTTTANPTLPTAVKPTLPTSTVAPIKRKLERTRKRRRRWCKLLIKGRLERNPQKYKKRCKHDCNILKIMLDNPKRYKRKCDKQRQRRRRRNRKKYSREYGPNHRRRHHHGDKSKKRTRNRGRRREPKRTTVKSPITPRTHNIDVT